MPQRRTLAPAQREELVAHRDHDPRPDVRARGSARGKRAAGMSPHAVARGGLLKAWDPDTVDGRLSAFETAALAWWARAAAVPAWRAGPGQAP